LDILVTGANGFIGKKLLKSLKKKYNVIGVDIEGTDIVSCDLTKLSDLHNLFTQYSPEIIIHLAAISSTGQSFQNVIMTQLVNFMGTVNLLEVAQNMNTNLQYFIFASSAEVYGGIHHDVYTENSLPRATSPYASSKVSAESFVNMKGHNSSLKTCCLRFCNTYGRLNNHQYLVEYLFNCFLTNKTPVLNTPNSVRQFMYLPDHIRVYETILNKKPTGIINASPGATCSILKMASKIKDITGSKLQIKSIKEHPITKIILNTDRLDKLGYNAEFTLQQGLQDFYKKL
jgi:nucleoside-diphosphate-sugar epimerase